MRKVRCPGSPKDSTATESTQPRSRRLVLTPNYTALSPSIWDRLVPGIWKAAAHRNSVDAIAQRFPLGGRDQVPHFARQVANPFEMHGQPRDISQFIHWYVCAGEMPENGSQLRLGMKSKTVVDGPDFSSVPDQTVIDFPLGVINHDIQQREP